MAPAPAVAAAIIAVADFEGGSIPPDKNDFWGRALANFMIADLQASRNLRVVDREHLNDTLREQRLSATDLSDPDARLRIGKILGARYFIFGTYTIAGDNAALTARMDSVETRQIVKSSSVAGKKQDLRTLSQDLAVDFLRPIDQVVADAEARRTPLSTGPPAQARSYFEQGLIDEQKGDYNRAVDSYAQALAVYPNYFDAREHLEKASEASARQ